MSKSSQILCGCIFAIGINLAGAETRLLASNINNPIVRVIVLETKDLRMRADGIKPLSISGIYSSKRKIQSINLRLNNGVIETSIDSNFKKWNRLPSDFELVVTSKDPRGIWLGNRRYRGKLKVILDSDNFLVINQLKMETYLNSVVGSEMPKIWPMEALKAQAVAARTYVLEQIVRRQKKPIRSTVSNQVYLGIEAETPRTIKAVKKTRSLVAVHKGRLINAVFHSSSGGRTEDSGSVWKYQMPYLVSVNDFDQDSPKYKWEKNFPQTDLKRIFYEINGLNSIEVLKKSNTGRILKARVYGPLGELTLSGKNIRNRLRINSTAVKFFVISNNRNKIENKDSFEDPYAFKSYFFSKPLSFIRKLSLKSKRDVMRKVIITKAPPIPPLITNENKSILVVKGFGAGHGVGMSQWGAYAMAKRGYGFERILKHYYKGIKIVPYQKIK